MSVRHQVRAYVERLFENLKDRLVEEHTIYCVYAPRGSESVEPEELELVDYRVRADDPEGQKKFIDRVVRESLEKEVMGLSLIALLLERDGEYFFSYENPLVEKLREAIKEKVESLKEE